MSTLMSDKEKEKEKEKEREAAIAIMNSIPIPILEKEEIDIGSDDHELESPLPLTVTSRVLYMLGDIASGHAYRFTQWLQLVRKRSLQHRSSGFPHQTSFSIGREFPIDDLKDPPLPFGGENSPEISLWDRLGHASMMDIDSSSFSWESLSSLHHTEHSSSSQNSDDDFNKPLEVTVNSGGVVFFALFNQGVGVGVGVGGDLDKESASVIKFSSSRMATQSERLGYQFAKCLGVTTPQARVIHNSSIEWQQIKEAAEKARESAASQSNEVGELTCSELLEALELSRCLLLMSYVHGSPLLESCKAFEPRETAERIASGLGRVLMLDLIIRNEDRLPCRALRWRGNFANLLLSDKMADVSSDDFLDSPIKRYRHRMNNMLQKERRATSIDSSRLNSHSSVLISQPPDLSDITESPKSTDSNSRSHFSDSSTSSDFRIVAIDSGVPRRPPAGKRANDQAVYPKLVELLLNCPDYASNLLFDITGGNLGTPSSEDGDKHETRPDMGSVVHEFRNGFRAALRDIQGYHIFLLTLHQKLESSLREFMNIINKISPGEYDKEDSAAPESPSQATGNDHCSSPPSKERLVNDNCPDFSDTEQRSANSRSSFSGTKESSDSISPVSRDGWHGKFSKGSGEHFRNLRLTAKLRDFHKLAKLDSETNKDLEQWTEMLKNDAVKLCQENNFNTGFFEGTDNNCVIDAYELKVRLEHILERITLISDAANTERPSAITSSLFIGGALAARSRFTLQHLGITHILCLCSNEIGQSESQYPDLFNYRNFSISDSEDENISSIFDEASDFIDHVEKIGGKVLVHCFEGRSRSATVVIAYLMLKKNYTLLEAWNTLKRVHRRAQPNDGFAKILQNLDKKLHGKISIEWQQRKPMMKVCPICGKNAGLSSSSLKLHLQKSHKKLSSGSVDSAMTMEIQKALKALKINRGGSVSPTQRQFQFDLNE